MACRGSGRPGSRAARCAPVPVLLFWSSEMLSRPELPVVVAGRTDREAHALEVEHGLVAQLRAPGRAAAGSVHELELRALEFAVAARERASFAGDMHRRVEVPGVAAYRDAALLGIDLRFVRGEQPLAHADLYVAGELGVARAREIAAVARDVDVRVVRVRLEQFLEARVRRHGHPARLFVGRERGRDKERDQQGAEEPPSVMRDSDGRLHRCDYNCRALTQPTFRGPSCTIPVQATRGSIYCATGSSTSSAGPTSGLAPASADASFRRYFRVTRPDGTYVAMDAPPDKEDVEPYLKVAGMLADIGVNAPRVLARNATDGFLLLTDLGSTTYLAELADRARAGDLYARRDRRAGPDPGRRRSPRRPAATVRRKAAALRDEPVPGLAARPAPRPAARRVGAWPAVRRLRPPGRGRPGAAARVRAPRLPLPQPDGLRRGQSGRARFPGCGAWPADLRPRVAAARLLRRVAAGAGRRVGARIPARSVRSGTRRSAPTRRSSCAGST